MPYAKPWTNDQIDILSSEHARARMELLIGVAPLYNIEFFGSKKHGIRCTLYSDSFDISWFSIPAANIYLSFQYLLIQIVARKLEPSHEDYEDTQKIKKLLVDSLTLSQERNIEHFSEKLINLAEGLTGESLAKVSNSETKKDTSTELTYKDEQGNKVTRLVSGERDIRRYDRLHVKFIEIDNPSSAILMLPLDRSSIVNNAHIYLNKNDLLPEQYYVKNTLLNECEISDIEELLELGSEISTHVLMHKCIINYTIENVLVTSFYLQDAGCTGHYISFLQVPIISSTYRMINVFMSEHGNLIYNAGCFYGNEEELTDEINSTHSGNPIVRQMYFNAIKYIKEIMGGARVATLDELRAYVKR